MPKKLFVGNLPYEADQPALLEWLAQKGYPAESAVIMIDRFSGQPRGFAFVEMADRLAKRCIVACNGRVFLGRTVIINEAHPLSERRAGRRLMPAETHSS